MSSPRHINLPHPTLRCPRGISRHRLEAAREATAHGPERLPVVMCPLRCRVQFHGIQISGLDFAGQTPSQESGRKRRMLLVAAHPEPFECLVRLGRLSLRCDDDIAGAETLGAEKMVANGVKLAWHERLVIHDGTELTLKLLAASGQQLTEFLLPAYVHTNPRPNHLATDRRQLPVMLIDMPLRFEVTLHPHPTLDGENGVGGIVFAEVLPAQLVRCCSLLILGAALEETLPWPRIRVAAGDVVKPLRQMGRERVVGEKRVMTICKLHSRSRRKLSMYSQQRQISVYSPPELSNSTITPS